MKAPSIGIYAIQDRDRFDLPGYTHDHSICSMHKGKVDHYLQLERWTRRKYDNEMHLHLEDLIDAGQLPQAMEADWVFVNSFAGASFRSQNGRYQVAAKPRTSLSTALTPMQGFGEFAARGIKAFSIDHELAHVASNLPFHGPFRENSVHVHFDGGASLSNVSVYTYGKGALRLHDYHWKLSHLSKFFNDNALTFALLGHTPSEHLAVPGKLMGFATLGTPDPDLADWLKSSGYFKDIWQDHHRFYTAARQDFRWEGRLGDTHDPFLQNIAATFQQIFMEEWLEYLANLQQNLGADDLYLSGGCALNILSNTRILKSGLFRDLFIPPCPGDSGLALGAAAYLEWQKHGEVGLHGPYLNSIGLAQGPLAHTPELVSDVATAIANGQVIGLHQGNAEAGPRALGNRSILARADSKAISQHVSMQCKGREWYRPIAPVMLEKHAKAFTGQSSIHHLSRFMLLDFEIPPQYHDALQGVVHANGTARIQTLFERPSNPFLWDLLSCLDEVHNVPALINTSFNAAGEPIVHTPQQAEASALRMGLDAWVAEGKMHPVPKTQAEIR